MTKKFLSILTLSGLLLGVTAPTANSQLKPEISFGWNTLDYGHPTVNSSYFIGEGSLSSNGSFYQPLIATLPQCQILTGMKLTPSDCIESLEVMNESGLWVRGEIAQHLPVRWQPKYKKIIDNAGNIVQAASIVVTGNVANDGIAAYNYDDKIYLIYNNTSTGITVLVSEDYGVSFS